MCCFEHSYSGIFQNRANRRVCFVGVSVFEVLDKSFCAGVASIELLSIVKAYLSSQIAIILLAILYLLLASLHFALLKNIKSLCVQLVLTTIVKVALVLLLLTLLSVTRVEGWNATGLVSLTLITVVIIKLFADEINCVNAFVIASTLVGLFAGIIAYVKLDKSIGRQVDMSGDWSYLIEFGFGVVLIVIVVGIELFVIMHTVTAVAIVAAVFGTFLSLISLMDFHQNMSINYWWWEKKMLHGCAYHVFRQYTLLWCLRVEEKPRVIAVFDNTPQEQAS